MKNLTSLLRNWFGLICVVGGCGMLLSGCSTAKPKEKPVVQRGWIGGEYRLALRHKSFLDRRDAISAFPKAVETWYKSGILILALGTNTPAYLAGLREGDLILELNHKPMTELRDFRQIIDQSAPGTGLEVKAFRIGQTAEYAVTAGRETYRSSGVFAVVLPPILRELKLVPTPEFSWGVVGYRRDAEPRVQLGSVTANYIRKCNTTYEPHDGDWQAWLAILEVSKTKTILSQEAAVSQTADSALVPAKAK